MNKEKKQKQKTIIPDIKAQSRGFTLIEALVAIAILMSAVGGPLTVAQRSLSFSRATRNQVTAFYLAQDALEYVRNVRDANMINANSWLQNLNECKNSPCKIDTSKLTTNTAVTNCVAGNCPLIKYNSATGLYGYDNGVGVNTKFTREIFYDDGFGGDEVMLSVKISWIEAGGASKSFTARENIFNWKQ